MAQSPVIMPKQETGYPDQETQVNVIKPPKFFAKPNIIESATQESSTESVLGTVTSEGEFEDNGESNRTYLYMQNH